MSGARVKGTVSRALRNLLIKRQGNCCHYCGCEMLAARRWHETHHPLQATLEHLVPHSDGGATDETNCVAACHDCNSERGRAVLAQRVAARKVLP